MKTPLLEYLANNIVIFDGAMGTSLQKQFLTPENFGGKDSCNEALNLYSPEVVRKVHLEYLQAGARVIETNTFSATPIVLKEFGLEKKVEQINTAAVKIARDAIKESGVTDECYIAGSIGPGSLLPSLGHISFDELSDNYFVQIKALEAAGADLLWIETCQDILQIKAALHAVGRLATQIGRKIPTGVSVTIESSGNMLTGSDIEAITAAIGSISKVDILGLNCATGPLEMVRHVAHLSKCCRKPISVMPNAGLPENVDGKAVYRLSPEELADYIHTFVTRDGVSLVGGCCGTTPAHIRAISDKIQGLKPAERRIDSVAAVSSLYNAVSLKQSPPPTLVGERTNATGAKHFRELLKQDNWEAIVSMGRDQAKGGAHLLDLNAAYVGRDEKRDIETLVPFFARQVKLPLMIDSTDPEVIEAALKRHGGRCVINSVNLEDGGKKLRKVAAMAADFGAALVCLTIDEKGMAHSCSHKLEIAARMHEILTGECGLTDSDLIFDPLTFTIGSGDRQLYKAASETLGALKEIKNRFPQCFTILGVSNVSFGLAPAAREVLNSVFLAIAVEKGLDLAIVNPAGIIPLFRISREQREIAESLIFNKSNGSDDLKNYINAFEDCQKDKTAAKEAGGAVSPEDAVREKIIDGDRTGLEPLILQLLKTFKPADLLNNVIVAAMREVGDLFGRSRLQLPFVLQSAEVVKAAVDILEPHMPKATRSERGPFILATVSGDVHDIGKNLVNIILSNNGYRVIDLGIKVDIDAMLHSMLDNRSNIIGMSGLLVRSTAIMKENLEELNRRGLTPHVLLGGAALTRDFVNNTLQPIYNGKVYYAQDAFESLSILDSIFGAAR